MASKKKQAQRAIIDMIQSGIESRADFSRLDKREDDLAKEINAAFDEILKMWKKK